jgi:hypothetical protein
MLRSAQGAFSELVGFVVCLGLPVGVGLGMFDQRRKVEAGPGFDWWRAIIAGGLAGSVGGFLFGKWVSSGDYLPLLAGIREISSPSTSNFFHFGVAVLIGVTIGLLFQRDVRGYGSCMGWGLGYGILWWFLGPLALWPLVSGARLDWSAQQGSAVFGSLIGHVLYGLISVSSTRPSTAPGFACSYSQIQ